MNQLYNAYTLFMSLLVEAMPFLLLGVLFSSALLLVIDEKKLVPMMPRNPLLGSLVGSCIGFIFPVCECGNVPVARRLLMQGVPTSVAIGFLLAAPTVNPIVIWSTWVAFREQPEIVVLRVICSLIVATSIAFIFSLQKDPQPLLHDRLARRLRFLAVESPTSKKKSSETSLLSSPLLGSGTFLLDKSGEPINFENIAIPEPYSQEKLYPEDKVLPPKLRLFVKNLVQELRELGAMLVIGSAIAAIIQVFVPREIVLGLGQGPITAILAMMGLAAIVSICSTVDSFFALSFASFFTSGSLLAFLVFGPMIDLKAIGLMLTIFRPRMVMYLFGLAAQLTFILALSYSYFF